MTDIEMPQLGETVVEGTITVWFKKVGDRVEVDEPLFEVSTDKVDSEVPSPVAGYVSEIVVHEGETVDVGAKVAVVSDQAPAGGDGGDGQAGTGTKGDRTATDSSGEPSPEQPAGAAEEHEDESDSAGGPDDRAGGGEAAGSGGMVDGAGDDGGAASGQPAPAEAPAAPSQSGERARAGAARRLLSPVVRRLIAEHDIDPDEIEGTGAQNRITRDDVLAYIDRTAGSQVAARASEPVARAAEPGTGAAEPAIPSAKRTAPVVPTAQADGDQVIPFSNIRRRTAEHMVRSLDTSAHVLTVTEVDFDNVDRVRLAARERWREEEGFSLTYLPFVSRAVVDAMRDFPLVNASVDGDSLVVHRGLHLGFAVDLSLEGLIVPVVHDADAKRLRFIARELADLAARARSKKLNADEIAGATFAITNPGAYGTLITYAIINQPNVAILSTDGVRKRPVVVELPDGSDAIAIHPVGNLALSFDHRAFDGAYASAFLARVRDILQTRDWSQEL